MLFMLQRFGTDKVGYTSAPIICIWFISIAGIGIYNFFKFDPTVLKAFNPKYIIEYFQRNKKEAWISLGGIVFAITGTVALFADLGHFTIRSIQISMCSVTYPAVILAYIGQASFLRKNSDLLLHAEPLYWPVFVVAILAAIIASQAIISGTFSVIQQSLSLGCFPRVKLIPCAYQAADMEAIAANRALEFAREIGINDAILEGDPSLVHLALKRGEQSLSPFGLLLEDIKVSSASFRTLLYSHIKREAVYTFFSFLFVRCSKLGDPIADPIWDAVKEEAKLESEQLLLLEQLLQKLLQKEGTGI
ncbi:potassium transporter 19-like [Quercus suber]|uniref:potassium transporter 19-like n=1 Tax=Quercus suber TaxID=58331 RepID=UPI0032DF8CC0